MNRILTTNIVDPSQLQPFTGPSLDFLQNATKEILAAVIQNKIGDTPNLTIPYVLYGCRKTSLGSNNYSYTEGYIFYNNEVYYFPAIPSINISNTDVVTIISTPDPTADPLTFSNGTVFNVHEHYTLQLTDALTGSGTFNFNQCVFIIQPKIRQTFSIAQTFSPFTPNGSTPNPLIMASYTTPNDGITRTYKLDLQVGVKLAGNVGPTNLQWGDYTLGIYVGGTLQYTINPRFPTPSAATVGYSGYAVNDGVLSGVMSIGPNVTIIAQTNPGVVFNGNMFLSPADSFTGPAGTFTIIEL